VRILSNSRSEVFNRGSATPRGSVEVLQGVRQMISSEAFFSLFQKCKTSKRLHKHKQDVKIAFYSLKIIHRLPMNLHAIISSPWQHIHFSLLPKTRYLPLPYNLKMMDRFVISRNKSSTSYSTDGGSDDLPSEDSNMP